MTIVERSLNPCCSGRWSGTAWIYSECAGIISLNPCCSGRWSGTLEFYNVQLPTQSLNPCCSGRWSGTWLDEGTAKEQAREVLILVVVDDGLVLLKKTVASLPLAVLILVVVDDGLVLQTDGDIAVSASRLNPCCSGRWSGTANLMDIASYFNREVLILVVVDDGLVPTGVFSDETEDRRLNPCCSGRWSGTWISID